MHAHHVHVVMHTLCNTKIRVVGHLFGLAIVYTVYSIQHTSLRHREKLIRSHTKIAVSSNCYQQVTIHFVNVLPSWITVHNESPCTLHVLQREALPTNVNMCVCLWY